MDADEIWRNFQKMTRQKKAGTANNNRRDVENEAKDEISALGKLVKSNEGHSQLIERWSQLQIKS